MALELKKGGWSRWDQIRCRHRLSKLLLRRDVRWTVGRKMWTRAHQEWLRGRRLAHAADQVILDDHLLGLEQLEGRLAALDAQLERSNRGRQQRPGTTGGMRDRAMRQGS